MGIIIIPMLKINKLKNDLYTSEQTNMDFGSKILIYLEILF